jgi:ribosomal protein S27E
MKKRDMLLGGPGLDGYTFRAEAYCRQCGQALIEALPRDDYCDTESLDSEVVPVPIFFGEADTAQHCGDCGEYLYGETEGSV